MVPRNILIFGDPSTDRRFVLRLLGVSIARSDHFSVLPPAKIFETQTHVPTNTRNKYKLYNTAGLESEVSKLEPREVLGRLYHFIRAFDGGINLLIYVVNDKPLPNNMKLFHEFLCRQDVPIILITDTPRPSRPSRYPPFKVVLPMDSANPSEIDRANLQEAISLHLKRYPKEVLPISRFEETTIQSWNLLERAAGWSISEYQDAFRATLMEDAFFSEEDAAAKCQDIVVHIKKHYFRNVIIFGDTGAGKTSVIRMLSDQVKVDIAKASSAGGSTFESKTYDVDINNRHYVFHDTVGFDDATSTSLSPQEALNALTQLMKKVEGGISLLVYVHRGKISPSQIDNYKLFSNTICQSKVPTVLVVTGLEEVDSRDEWWEINKSLFNERGMGNEYHACITSTKGSFNPKHKEYVYQDIYEESKQQLEAVFVEAALETPWKVPASYWKSMLVQVYNLFAAKFKWGPLGSSNIWPMVEMQDGET